MARQMQGLWRIALGLRDYPTGFYFAGMTREKDGLPFPLLGFISCVRDDADAVMARLSFVDHLGHDLNLPIRVQSNDGIVRVSLGDTPSSGKMLSDLPEFKSLATYQTNIPALWTVRQCRSFAGNRRAKRPGASRASPRLLLDDGMLGSNRWRWTRWTDFSGAPASRMGNGSRGEIYWRLLGGVV